MFSTCGSAKSSRLIFNTVLGSIYSWLLQIISPLPASVLIPCLPNWLCFCSFCGCRPSERPALVPAPAVVAPAGKTSRCSFLFAGQFGCACLPCGCDARPVLPRRLMESDTVVWITLFLLWSGCCSRADPSSPPSASAGFVTLGDKLCVGFKFWIKN